MKIAVLGFTSKGKILGEKIVSTLEHALIVSNAKEFVREKFNEFDAWVFVGAVGIAVRYIAPSIQSKTVDPAVIVVDELGNYIIPILSGHIGGGNNLAKSLEKIVKGISVITTATDINKVLAIDSYAVRNNMKIINPENIKWVSSQLLENKKVGLFVDKENQEILKEKEIIENFQIVSYETENLSFGVCISYDDKAKHFETTLNLVPCDLVLGIGCRRNTSKESMKEWICKELKDREISPLAISKIVSIDIKKDEEAIIELSKALDVEFEIYTAGELQNVEGEFTPSEFVSLITGVDNVCERSALVGGGKLIVKKTKCEGKTFALAKKGKEVL